MLKKSYVLVLSLVLALSLLITGCSTTEPSAPTENGNTPTTPTNPEPTTEYKDTIVVGRTSEGVAFDPFVSIDTSTLEVCVQIYDTLFMMNDEMEVVGMLADTWEFVDEKTLDVTIKTGVKFHNGDEMTAEDVKFSIERMQTSSAAGYIFNFLQGVEVVDADTVRFTTKEPFAPILAHLSHPAASIYNKAYVEEKGENYGREPIGTGPYKFVEWRQGDNVKLEAFSDYFRGESATKNVVFRAIPEASQRTIGIETGELDIAYDILPTDVSRLDENADVDVNVVPGLSYNYLGLNTTKAPFDNVKVRQAIAYAIDKASIVDNIFKGAASVADSPVPPLSFGASSNVTKYDLNIEKAKELLTEAGFPNGFSTTLWCRDDQVVTEIAQVVQSNLKQIGIEVKLEVMEWGAYLEKTANGEQEMYILGWSNVTGDANYILYGLYSTNQFGVAGNRAFYSNPRVDELLAMGVSTTDQGLRSEYYEEIQQIVTEETPLVSIYYRNIIAANNKKVEDFVPAPTAYHKIFNVKVQK